MYQMMNLSHKLVYFIKYEEWLVNLAKDGIVHIVIHWKLDSLHWLIKIIFLLYSQLNPNECLVHQHHFICQKWTLYFLCLFWWVWNSFLLMTRNCWGVLCDPVHEYFAYMVLSLLLLWFSVGIFFFFLEKQTNMRQCICLHL